MPHRIPRERKGEEGVENKELSEPDHLVTRRPADRTRSFCGQSQTIRDSIQPSKREKPSRETNAKRAGGRGKELNEQTIS